MMTQWQEGQKEQWQEGENNDEGVDGCSGCPSPKTVCVLTLIPTLHTNYPFPLCFQSFQCDEGSSCYIKTLPTPHPLTRHVKHACLGMFYVSGCLLLSPSLANTRWRGIHVIGRGKSSSSHLFEFIGCDGEGRPSPSCLQVLFDMTRGENPHHHICLTLFDTTGRGDPTHHVCLMRQGTEHQKCAYLGILLVFMPSLSIQTCKMCPDGHVLHVWCCLQH